MTRWRIILSLAMPLLVGQAMPPDDEIPLVRPNAVTSEQSDIYFWLLTIVIFAVAVGLSGYFLYRWIKKANETESTSLNAAFSLSEMRRLYEAGEISHDEYMVIRNKLLGPAKAAMLGEKKAAAAEQAQETTTASSAGVAIHEDDAADEGEAPDAVEPKPPAPPPDPLFEWEKEKREGDGGVA